MATNGRARRPGGAGGSPGRTGDLHTVDLLLRHGPVGVHRSVPRRDGARRRIDALGSFIASCSAANQREGASSSFGRKQPRLPDGHHRLPRAHLRRCHDAQRNGMPVSIRGELRDIPRRLSRPRCFRADVSRCAAADPDVLPHVQQIPSRQRTRCAYSNSELPMGRDYGGGSPTDSRTRSCQRRDDGSRRADCRTSDLQRDHTISERRTLGSLSFAMTVTASRCDTPLKYWSRMPRWGRRSTCWLRCRSGWRRHCPRSWS